MRTNIEPGCLCLCFDPRLIKPEECRPIKHFPVGAEVEIKFGVSGIAEADAWEVDRELNYFKKYRDPYHALSQYLIRIDGGEDETIEKIKTDLKITA